MYTWQQGRTSFTRVNLRHYPLHNNENWKASNIVHEVKRIDKQVWIETDIQYRISRFRGRNVQYKFWEQRPKEDGIAMQNVN